MTVRWTARSERLLVADHRHAIGAQSWEEEHLDEVQQNAVSAPHIGLQCLQHHRQLTLDPCDLEELSDRDMASAAGSVLHRGCRQPLHNRHILFEGTDTDFAGNLLGGRLARLSSHGAVIRTVVMGKKHSQLTSGQWCGFSLWRMLWPKTESLHPDISYAIRWLESEW